MQRDFRTRVGSEAQEITAWRWEDTRDINSAIWRKEDAGMINQHLKREGRGMLSSPNIRAVRQWGERGQKGVADS